ncbi:MAG: hypothetical protein WCO13_05390 [Bacteroidota bacterium]
MKKEKHKQKRVLIILIVILFFIHSIAYSQYKRFSGLHQPIDSSLYDFLHKSGFGKITVYYDDLNKKGGNWEIYPYVKASNNLIFLNVSSMKGVEPPVYNFILFMNKLSNEMIDTLGPFYDSSVDAIKYSLKNNRIDVLRVRLRNPPEAEEPKYTFMVYKRNRNKLMQIKSYDKD